MDAFECIMTRRSIRAFRQQEVEWEKIGRICQAAINAPSAGNLQDLSVIVVFEKDKINQLAEASNQLWMNEAAVHLVICSEFEKTKRFYGIRGERLYSIQDVSAAAMNALLAAHNFGLAACWVGAFDEDRVSTIVQIPDYSRPQVIIPIGYSDHVPDAPDKFNLVDKVFLNTYNNRYWNPLVDVVKDWSPVWQKAASRGYERTRTLSEHISQHTKKISEKVKKHLNRAKDGAKNKMKSRKKKKR
jgi:nitroreductase